MFWSKARKIKDLEFDLDRMEKLIGNIKIQRDGALAERDRDRENGSTLVKIQAEQTTKINDLVSERDQLHRRVEELEGKISRLTPEEKAALES